MLSADDFYAAPGAFAGTGGNHIVYNTSNGVLYYDASGDGTGLVFEIAELKGAPDAHRRRTSSSIGSRPERLSRLAGAPAVGQRSVLDDADERQLAKGVGDVHAVADDEQVGAGEADVIGRERLGELARLVEEDGDADPPARPAPPSGCGHRRGCGRIRGCRRRAARRGRRHRSRCRGGR